jgi:hypothetical protein
MCIFKCLHSQIWGTFLFGFRHSIFFLQSEFISLASNPQHRGTGLCINVPPWHGGLVITPGNGFPFHYLLRLSGLRWRYSHRPPRGKYNVYIVAYLRHVTISIILYMIEGYLKRWTVSRHISWQWDKNVRFRVLMTVDIKIAVLRVVTRYSLVGRHQTTWVTSVNS